MLVACGAKRWLARYAAGATRCRIQCDDAALASGCMTLITCLPALAEVVLDLPNWLASDILDCMLQALAWCSGLRDLNLCLYSDGDDDVLYAFPAAPAFGLLRSLTKLELTFDQGDTYALANVAGALLPLTGLTELQFRLFCLPHDALVPAALGQLKMLRALGISAYAHCVLEAGCLALPNLLSLELGSLGFSGAEVLPGATALQSLTRVKFTHGQGLPYFAQLVQLPRLRHAEFQAFAQRGARLELSGLPPIVGSALLHLDVSGHGLAQFPLALTRLVALECLKMCGNEFGELPTAITALSRLTELTLGRVMSMEDPLQVHGKRCLDVRALGDLSGFPALGKLQFSDCEVMLCGSMLGAVRHASLTSLTFVRAHPAPGCALMVLQLSAELLKLKRGGLLKVVDTCDSWDWHAEYASRDVRALPPFYKFKAALWACGM